MDGMHTRLPREREPKRQIRNFIQPTLDLFTTKPDGRSWPNAHRTRAIAPRYLEALFLPGRGKHMRGIAKRVHLPEDRVRRFISHAPWNHQALQDHLAENIPDAIQDPTACLLVDEVGLVKDGNHSVGVARQYSGAAGKVDNCQVAVDLIYAVPAAANPDQKTWPLGMEIYLPKPWCEDQTRRRQVGVPDEVAFRTKPQIALDMIQRARTAGVEYGCVGADAVYGDTKAFREQLRAWESPYALGITPSKHRVIPADVPLEPAGSNQGPGRPSTHDRYPEEVKARSPKEIADGVEDWEEITWTQGSDGPLSGRFHFQRVRVVENATRRYASDEVIWLVIEKRGEEVKAFYCGGMDDASPEHLVSLCHFRWVIEQFHREAKQLLGLEEFEGRLWKGWNHHVSMVLLTYAFISQLRAEQAEVELPPFPRVLAALVHEVATQTAMEHGLDRRKAEEVGSDMVRRLTEW